MVVVRPSVCLSVCPSVRPSDRHGRAVAKRCKIGLRLLLIINRKSHIGFQMTWKSLTLDDLKHGRWNRGSRGSSCSPNFWHRRAGHSSCSPKSLSLLHCDVRLSRIDLDILEFCRSVGRSRTKNFQLQGGSAPGPHWGLHPQTSSIGSRSTCSPWPRPLLTPPTFKHFQRPWP